MAIDKSLLAGSTGLLILRLLEEDDLYGYQMIERLRERFGRHVFAQGGYAVPAAAHAGKPGAGAVLRAGGGRRARAQVLPPDRRRADASGGKDCGMEGVFRRGRARSEGGREPCLCLNMCGGI